MGGTIAAPINTIRRGHRQFLEGFGELVVRRRRIDAREAPAQPQANRHCQARVALEEYRLELGELVPRRLLLEGGQLVVLLGSALGSGLGSGQG